MKSVLIAHQSTIPHYRVPFYNALERLRPDSWQFKVVFDSTELKTFCFFKEPLDTERFKFPVLDTKTLSAKVSGKMINYQSFWLKASTYDLVVVEYAVNNLTYPLCQLHQIGGTCFAYWGHDRDRFVKKASGLKLMIEKSKIALARQADGFFAYTPRVKLNLQRHGLAEDKIFTVYNTIDINHQRAVFERWLPQREATRQELGLHGKKVLLFIGRFTANKRTDFLLEAFSQLRQTDDGFHLLLVGSGGEAYLTEGLEDITYFGPIVDVERLGPLYVASDLFAFPGSVGLGPLQALCYDLPVITIESPTHMPEFEYLTPMNSIVLEAAATPAAYAKTITDLIKDEGRLAELKAGTWPSIKHLTIERMARNFIDGINAILDV